MEFSRIVRRRYADPLDRVWLTTVERLGFRVARTSVAYATSDGRGTIGVGTADSLDADDCLAQILFHELCHAIVQGEKNLHEPDWGLCNETDRDRFREHACLRLQAVLTERHGLRQFLAPTTDYREYYDALPADPLEGDAEDPSVPLARLSLGRADDGPWRAALDVALRATAQIAAAALPFATPGDLLQTAPPTRAGRHPSGAALGPVAQTCGDCAWFLRVEGGAVPDRSRCRVHQRRLEASTPSCEAWEGRLDCQTCGGCCREAYGAVEIGPREPVRKRHPEFIVQLGPRLGIRREGERCAALQGSIEERFTCLIYEARPKTCRDFERGGRNCLDARQRLGLSQRLGLFLRPSTP